MVRWQHRFAERVEFAVEIGERSLFSYHHLSDEEDTYLQWWLTVHAHQLDDQGRAFRQRSPLSVEMTVFTL